MKRISQELIVKLKDYYKVNPRVIAFVLAESEWVSLIVWDADCIKIKVEHGARVPKPTSSHHVAGGLDLEDLSALVVNRWKHAHFWLAGKSFPKMPKCFDNVDIENADHLIFIRLTKVIDRECHPCKVKDICPNLLGYLTHEFVHIVEYEQDSKILPEKPEAYYSYVHELLKEIFAIELSIAGKAESGRDTRT